MIKVTERALKALAEAVEDHKNNTPEKVYVRAGVKGGGCSGFENILVLEEGKTEKDTIYNIGGLDFIIDNRSMVYMEGTELDFVTELNKMGFKFTNPRAKSSCGCGSSFSME